MIFCQFSTGCKSLDARSSKSNMIEEQKFSHVEPMPSSKKAEHKI